MTVLLCDRIVGDAVASSPCLPSVITAAPRSSLSHPLSPSSSNFPTQLSDPNLSMALSLLILFTLAVLLPMLSLPPFLPVPRRHALKPGRQARWETSTSSTRRASPGPPSPRPSSPARLRMHAAAPVPAPGRSAWRSRRWWSSAASTAPVNIKYLNLYLYLH
jgi:hypothetical protein